MTSASIGTKVGLLRGVVPQTVKETAELTLKSACQAKVSQLPRLFSEQLGCEHNDLVFDDINDVSCRHCGKDFTD